MKIGFFGTPDLACCCLNGLSERHEILFVVAPEDKPSGRHLKMVCCQTKAFALEHRIDLLQPKSLRDPGFQEALKRYDADIYVVVAYGKLIPPEVYEYPRLKTVNLHPSLLPRYRGAAPMQWALINGETETGITVQLINERLDAGDIVVQKKIPLDDRINALELNRRVEEQGHVLLNEAIEMLASGRAVLIRQDESMATTCPKIDRETACIDWTRPAVSVHNLVRGLNPKPGAWTLFRGRVVKIWKTVVPADAPQSLAPGRLLRLGKKRLIAGTGQGAVEILSLQPETRAAMDALAFINGHRIEEGDAFSSTP